MQIARFALCLQPLAIAKAIFSLYALHFAIGDPQPVERRIAHHDGARWEPLSLDEVKPKGAQGMVALDAIAVIAGEVFVTGDSTTPL